MGTIARFALFAVAAALVASTFGCSLFDGFWNYAHSTSYNEGASVTDPHAMTGGIHSTYVSNP